MKDKEAHKEAHDGVQHAAAHADGHKGRASAIAHRSDPLARAWHTPAESLLSSASGFNNYRGFVNLALLILVLSNFRLAVENVIKYGFLVNPLSWFSWWLDDPYHWPSLTLYASLNVYVLAALGIERLSAQRRISEAMTVVLHTVNIGLEITVPVLVVLRYHPNPAGSSFVLVQASILFMKLVSYAMTNKWWRLRAGKKTDGAAPADPCGPVKYPDNLTVGNMYYFAFAPTLCYELNFPRLERVRKRFLIKHLAQATFFGALIFALGEQWIVPTVRNSMRPLQESEYSVMLERLLKLAIPNHFLWLMFFYAFFHCLLNVTAELLRFADREFYKDWWNATTVKYFWQNWNIPVHKWCARHVYMPLLRSGWSNLAAQVTVFGISAIFHELLVSVPLGMFKVWSFAAMMAQLPLAVLTEHPSIKNTQTGNVIVWLSLVLGQPVAILAYVHDYLLLHNKL